MDKRASWERISNPCGRLGWTATCRIKRFTLIDLLTGPMQRICWISSNRMALASAKNNRYTVPMRALAKRFLFLFLVLWLPTQSYAATAMPACTGGGRAMTATQTCEHIGPERRTPGSAGFVCDDCAVCHTSGVFFVAVINPPSNFNVVRDSRPASRFFSIVLERFQRPPLAS